MIESKLDTNSIETAFYEILDSVYTGDIYCGNRPHKQDFKLNQYVVIKANGNSGRSIIANDKVISSQVMCSVQIWTREIQNGFKNMNNETWVREILLSVLPATTPDYRFTYSDEVGTRDHLGFHGKYINIKCTII
jgi:hypothetical protein